MDLHQRHQLIHVSLYILINLWTNSCLSSFSWLQESFHTAHRPPELHTLTCLTEETAPIISHLCLQFKHELRAARCRRAFVCQLHAYSSTANKKQCRGLYGPTPMRSHREEPSFCLQTNVPQRSFFPPNYGEGGMGNRRARNTKRPHFRLLSQLSLHGTRGHIITR